jgi:hypothetical protein
MMQYALLRAALNDNRVKTPLRIPNNLTHAEKIRSRPEMLWPHLVRELFSKILPRNFNDQQDLKTRNADAAGPCDRWLAYRDGVKRPSHIQIRLPS